MALGETWLKSSGSWVNTTVQTTIPSANAVSGLTGNHTDPSLTSYFEQLCMDIKQNGAHPPGHGNADEYHPFALSYANNNPSRAILTANPFGNKYTVKIRRSNNADGSTSGGGLHADGIRSVNLCLRVELLEEEIIR